MFRDLAKYVVSAAALVVIAPLTLMAEDLKLITGVTLKEEISDNILMSSSFRKSDFITTVTPFLDFSGADERGELKVSSGVNFLDYARNSTLNALDYFVQSGLDFRIDPRLSVSAGSGYVRDSRHDHAEPGTGLLSKTGSNRQNYRLSGDYLLTERSSTNFSYAYSQETFSDSLYLNTSVHTVNIAQAYDLESSPRKERITGVLGYSHYGTGTTLVENYSGSVGVENKFNELWGFVLSAGGRYTRSEFDVATTSSVPVYSATSYGNGLIGSLSINYADESTTAGLSFNHDIVSASGNSGATQRTSISTNLNEKITSDFSGNLGFGYFKYKSDQNQFSSRAFSQDDLVVTAGLRYNFTDDLFLEGDYRYNYSSSQSMPHTSQNLFMLRLTVRQDIMRL
ncbi:MAG: outer membrane beta-barrel protein [Geobacteraceae bacterium]|nr:outer membrane beta-barrel protein [Geobacteraceae bacterium]